jgi:hypothetical protein
LPVAARTGPWRAAALALSLWLAGPAAARAEAVELTRTAAHAIAQQAYLSGDAALAYALARRLLQADPQDARALLVLAATAPLLNRPQEGVAAGRAAWAAARGAPLLRYEVARFTARSALAAGRPGTAQLWLRRAADVAPDAAAADRTARDYAALRAARRLHYGIDLSLTPTSNLNGGASGDLLVVNGALPIGTLSGDAQALSGTRAALSGQVGLRVAETARTAGLIALRAYATANALSSDAQAQAPLAEGSDFDMQVIEALAVLDLRPKPGAPPLRLTFGAGHSWYGGEALGPHLRGEVGLPLASGPGGALRLSFGAERQWRDDGPTDAAILRLDAGRSWDDVGRVGLSLTLREVSGEAVNTDHRAAILEARFDPRVPLGPVEVGLTARIGLADYPEYRLGPFGVIGGREDWTTGMDIEAAFPDLARLGYVPVITLTAERTTSNVSRFETETVGVTFGLKSQF